MSPAGDFDPAVEALPRVADEVAELRADLRFVADVAALLLASLTPSLVVARVTEAATAGFCDVCAIHLLDESGTLTLPAISDRRIGATNQLAFALALATPDGPVREAMRTRQPQLFQRGLGHGSLVEQTAFRLLHTLRARSLVVVPITIGHAVVGTASFIESTRSGPFEARNVDVAAAVGSQLSIALENVQLRIREAATTDRSRFTTRVTEHLFSTFDRVELLQTLLAGIVAEIADVAAVVTVANERLKTVAQATLPDFPEGLALTRAMERDLVTAIAKERPLLFNRALGESAGFWMMAPLGAGGRGHGAIVCYSTTRSYGEADLELLGELCRRAAVALDNAESFSRERRLTQSLQQATLPSHLSTIPGSTLSAIYLPGSAEDQVGGDWYDSFQIDEHRFLVTIGDVTGHGLSASVVMGKLRHTLNVVGLYETDPARVLDAAERVVLQRFPDTIATAFVGIIDTRTNTITYANAGHPSPLIRCRDGSIAELRVGGLPIGLRGLAADVGPTARSLDDVELLAFYTDGLTESTRAPLDGERRLIEALGRDEALLACNAAEFLRAACVDGAADDDVAVLTIAFADVERWSFDATSQAVSKSARRMFLERLRARLQPASSFDDIEVIFGELVANVARHAPGPFDVALDWRGPRPVVHVLDRGTPFVRPARRSLPGESSEGGRGLWLVERLGGQVEVRHVAGGGNHVSVALPVGNAHHA